MYVLIHLLIYYQNFVFIYLKKNVLSSAQHNPQFKVLWIVYIVLRLVSVVLC